jgi:hypothetical protein
MGEDINCPIYRLGGIETDTIDREECNLVTNTKRLML